MPKIPFTGYHDTLPINFYANNKRQLYLYLDRRMYAKHLLGSNNHNLGDVDRGAVIAPDCRLRVAHLKILMIQVRRHLNYHCMALGQARSVSIVAATYYSGHRHMAFKAGG